MRDDETIMTLSEAAASLPRIKGRKVHTSTLWRWIRKGINGVRLESLRLGGRFCTTQEALRRFGRELAARELEPKPRITTSKSPTIKARTRSVERAEKVLKKAGIA